jgi:UDP-N-acetyl-2-amino-2-deoxyglucuronate dehydrogenase
MTKEKVTGFAIVGTGAIAGIHAQAIEAIADAVLLGVYSQTKAKAEVFAQENHCQAFGSLDELLKLEGLDIVCICTPSGVHMEPALKAIEAGKHCLIEKPLEVTLARTDKIIDAAKNKGVNVAVVFPTRFYPASQQLKQAIDQGRFEKPALASAYVKWSRTETYYQSNAWRGTWKLDGGGALMNQAIHSVDMLQWCMGPVVSVMAMSGNIKHTGIEVEDTLVALLRFANGAMGTLECSTAVYPGSFKKLEIMGTGGTVVIEDNDFQQWQFEKAGDQDSAVHVLKAADPSKGGFADPKAISYLGHQKQMEDLISAIAEGRKPMIDGIEGRKSVEIVLAIYESTKTGKLIHLPFYE